MGSEASIFIRAHHLLFFRSALRYGSENEAWTTYHAVLETAGADTKYFIDVLGVNGIHGDKFLEMTQKAYERPAIASDDTRIVVTADKQDDLCRSTLHGQHCKIFDSRIEHSHLQSFIRDCERRKIKPQRIDKNNVSVSALEFRKIITGI